MLLTPQEIDSLPSSPGVYKMLDAQGKIIYIGKAKDLKSRVSTYFQHSYAKTARINSMVTQVQNIDLTITASEVDALVLEQQLITSIKPKYNIIFKDDKSYPYISLSHDPYPRVEVIHCTNPKEQRKTKDLFGPWPQSAQCWGYLQTITQMFHLRTCTNNEFSNRSRPCMLGQIGKCSSPCVDEASNQDYPQRVQMAKDVLKGQVSQVIKTLEQQMLAHSNSLEFEQAAKARDMIEVLKNSTRQSILDPSASNSLVFYAHPAPQGKFVYLSFAKVINGVLQSVFTQKYPLLELQPTNENEFNGESFDETKTNKISKDARKKNNINTINNTINTNTTTTTNNLVLDIESLCVTTDLPQVHQAWVDKWLDSQELSASGSYSLICNISPNNLSVASLPNVKVKQKLTNSEKAWQQVLQEDCLLMQKNDASIKLKDNAAIASLKLILSPIISENIKTLDIDFTDISHHSLESIYAGKVCWHIDLEKGEQKWKKENYRLSKITQPSALGDTQQVKVAFNSIYAPPHPLANIIFIDGDTEQLEVAHQVLCAIGRRDDVILMCSAKGVSRKKGEERIQVHSKDIDKINPLYLKGATLVLDKSHSVRLLVQKLQDAAHMFSNSARQRDMLKTRFGKKPKKQ